MEDVYEEIYAFHSRYLHFDDVRSKPVMVVFSAIPGSGKSELTKRLAGKYGFFRIANKDIRYAIQETGHADDVIIGEYTAWLFSRVTRDMSLSIVFDRNIDQWYEPSKRWALDNGYVYITVRIEVARHDLEKRLLHREGDRTAKVFEVLDFYSDQHMMMTAQIPADIVLEGNYDLDAAAKHIARLCSQK